MGFGLTAIDFASALVILIGAWAAIRGGMRWAEGYGSENPGEMEKGQRMLVGGIAVIAIGFLLVPELKTLIPKKTTAPAQVPAALMSIGKMVAMLRW